MSECILQMNFKIVWVQVAVWGCDDDVKVRVQSVLASAGGALQTLKFTRFAARFTETPPRFWLLPQTPQTCLKLPCWNFWYLRLESESQSSLWFFSLYVLYAVASKQSKHLWGAGSTLGFWRAPAKSATHLKIHHTQKYPLKYLQSPKRNPHTCYEF